MKQFMILGIVLLSFGSVKAQAPDNTTDLAYSETSSKFSELSDDEKAGAIEALISGNCQYKGIKLYGKVQFVTSFPDLKIQYVKSFPDLKVKWVTSFPDKCGLWQETKSFPDIKIQVVESFPDIKVQIVDSFPGQ